MDNNKKSLKVKFYIKVYFALVLIYNILIFLYINNIIAIDTISIDNIDILFLPIDSIHLAMLWRYGYSWILRRYWWIIVLGLILLFVNACVATIFEQYYGAYMNIIAFEISTLSIISINLLLLRDMKQNKNIENNAP